MRILLETEHSAGHTHTVLCVCMSSGGERERAIWMLEEPEKRNVKGQCFA